KPGDAVRGSAVRAGRAGIEDIYRTIAQHDDVKKADRIFAALEKACRALAEFPRARQRAEGTPTARHRRIPRGPLQTLSGDLSDFRHAGRRLLRARRKTGHAKPTAASAHAVMLGNSAGAQLKFTSTPVLRFD